METVLEELAAGFPDAPGVFRITVRLLAATLFAAVIGYERESTGKAAGLRTHMLVSLGSAMFVLIASESGFAGDGLSRVVQGVAAGIGFIGAGAILKHVQGEEVRGLTTAASLWMTAGLGAAAGMGLLGLSLIAVILAWIILAVLTRIEARI